MNMDGILWRAMERSDARGKAAMGLPADDEAMGVLKYMDPVEYVGRLASGTDLDPRDLHEFAETQAEAVLTVLGEAPPHVAYALLRGFLQQGVLVGYHAHTIANENR